MYKLVFYVPESHLDAVKTAVFTAGAGKIGDYDQCCWQVLGNGQFRPLPGSQPFSGTHQQLESAPEWRVEMVCENALIQAVRAALLASHPFEEPAYDIWQLVDVS